MRVNRVRIDKRGAPYRVGPDGRRDLTSSRPKDKYSPEEWKSMTGKEKEIAIEVEKYETEKKTKKKDTSGISGLASGEKGDDEEVDDDIATPSIVLAEQQLDDVEAQFAELWEHLISMDHHGYAGEVDDHEGESHTPAMPTSRVSSQQHRDKNTHWGLPINQCIPIFNAMVTRQVTRKEMLANPKAMEAFMKEWQGHWDQDVYDFSIVREHDDVANEARRTGSKVHMARVHGLIYEKNFQLKEDNPQRKFKGRGVVLGDQVKDQNMEAALFQDLGNTPATFDASRWADFYGCLPGHDVQMADAIQAYIQAKLTGTPCWVELPPEAWPKHVNLKGLRRPVCRLVKALYGHPDAGTMWEQHCHNGVQKVGFRPVRDEWPSLYWNSQLKLLLVVYVDDLKLAGPTRSLKQGWELLRSQLRLEPETPLGLYLGCNVSKSEGVLHDKTKVTTVTYDMELYLEMTVSKYVEVTGVPVDKLRKVHTPSPVVETKHHKARAPLMSGVSSHRCTWCGHTMPVDQEGRLIPPPPVPNGPAEQEIITEENRGALAPHAASILMKLLYAARICRFDLLRSINNLARNVTKWSKKDDVGLLHLISYVHHTKHHKMIGWVGDELKDLSIGLFADADYAGCGESLRSTTGVHMHIQGGHTRFPLAGMSKRQGCISHSTPEAEIVAADHALSRVGLPAITLWCCLGGKEPNFVFYDDNQTMIGVVRTGKNPTMRHLERSHGISVAWMHDVFQANYVSLAYEVTAKMAADIHTKAFRDGLSWQHACQLINIFPPQQLNSQEIMDLMRPTHSQSEDARGQKLLTFKNEVPCFPYTQTPILPQVLYREGLSGKEGLQEVDGADPILVVKFPKLLRVPPRALHPGRYLRSTWVLREGRWSQIEDRAIIPPETQKFDRYVERAVFQYHFQRRDPPGSVPPAAVNVAAPSSFSGPGATVSLRWAAPDTRVLVALLVLAAHGGSRGVVSRHSFRAVLSGWRDGRSVDENVFWFVAAHALSVAVSKKQPAKPWCFVPASVTVQSGETQVCQIILADSKGKEITSCKVSARELITASETSRAETGNACIQGCCVWGARIILKEASPQSPVWMLHGVSIENWWNRHAPDGIQIVHVPLENKGQFATGELLRACAKRYLKSSRDVLFVGAECLHVGSWLGVEHSKMNYGPPQPVSEQEPLGHVGQCISDAVKVGQKNVILELPIGDLESSSISSSRQIKDLMRSATSVVSFDGCCFGHRTKPDVGEAHSVQYVKSRWKFMSWGLDLRVDNCWKLCTKQHEHAQTVVPMGDNVLISSSHRRFIQKPVPESRSSKVSRRIIKAVHSQTCEVRGGQDERKVKPTNEKQEYKENCIKREHAETAVPNVPLDHRYPARMLIEFCCSQNSAMGNNNKESRGCRVVRVHEQLDAKTAECRNNIMMEVEAFRVEHPSAPVFVHAALPCTGGSSWQFVNQAVGNCETIKKKRQQFRTLLKALKRLLKSLSSDGGCVFLTFELPRTCLYWKWSEVQSLVHQYQLCKFRIDGCAVGVKDTKGLPLLKSWTLASNVGCMNEIEEHICDGTHTHGSARGSSLKHAENYTKKFVLTVHRAWRHECVAICKSATQSIKQSLMHVRRNKAMCCVVLLSNSLNLGRINKVKHKHCDSNSNILQYHESTSQYQTSWKSAWVHLACAWFSACPVIRASDLLVFIHCVCYWQSALVKRAVKGTTTWVLLPSSAMAQDTVYEGQLLTIDKRGSFAGALETIPGEVNGVKLLHAVEGMLARTFQVLQERGQSPPTRIVGGMVVSGELVNRWIGLGINPTLLILAAWPMIPCYNRENTWRYMMRSLAAAMHDDHRSKMTFQQAAQKIKKLALVMKHALAGDRQDVKLNCLDQAIDRNLYVYATEFAEKLMDEIKAGKVDPSRLLADVVADQSFLYGAVTTSLRFKPPKSQSFLFQTRTDQWYNANSEVYHHNLTRGRAFASRTKLQEIIQQTKDHVNMLGYAIRSWNAIMMEEGQPDIVFVTINEVMKMMFQPQDDCDSAAMAAAVNEMQAVMICTHCLRSYLSAQRDEFSRNWSQNVRQDEVHTIHRSIQDLLDRVIGDPPMGLGVLEYLTQTSFQPLGLEGSDVRQFETLTSMENSVLEELQHRDASRYPSLMPNDNNFPFEKVKHPGWAKIPSTQSRSSGSTNNIPGPSSEVPQDEGPKPPSYPPPGAGSSSKTRSSGSRWQLPIDPEKHGEENLQFINQDGKRMMSRFYYHKDGPSGQFFIPSYDETPSVAKGMVTSVGETYLRRVTTQLARLCSASRWSSSAGSSQMTFDLDHYVGQEDLEWLKFYQAAFHTLNLETALAYPHPIVMAALTVGGFNESFVKYEGQGGIVSVGEVRAAYNSVLSSLRPAGNTSIAAIKNEDTILVIDVPLHIRIQKMYQDPETFLFKSCNWNAVRVAAPNYNAAGGWKSPNEFPKLMERAQDLLRVASPYRACGHYVDRDADDAQRSRDQRSPSENLCEPNYLRMPRDVTPHHCGDQR